METSTFRELDIGETIRGFVAGQKLFGRYTLIRTLGRGGMGVVWLARDERLEQDVALKFLPELIRADPAAVDDLKHETRRSLLLTHRNIVRIYDFEEDAQSAALAMEYVAGETLSAMRISRPGKVFQPAELKRWAGELCDALDYAHRKGKIVHRDLKPANLMVGAHHELKVTDFGVARSISESVSRVSLHPITSGTLAYMSPQQALGQPAHPRDDIYSLGATLYELLTGRPPFFSGNIQHQLENVVPPLINQRRRELEIDSAPVPVTWEQTIAACLAKDPAARPADAAEVRARLFAPAPAPAAKPTPVSHVPPDPVQVATEWWNAASKGARRAVLATLILCTCTAAAGTYYFAVVKPRADKIERQRIAAEDKVRREKAQEIRRVEEQRQRALADEQLRRELIEAERRRAEAKAAEERRVAELQKAAAASVAARTAIAQPLDEDLRVDETTPPDDEPEVRTAPKKKASSRSSSSKTRSRSSSSGGLGRKIKRFFGF